MEQTISLPKNSWAKRAYWRWVGRFKRILTRAGLLDSEARLVNRGYPPSLAKACFDNQFDYAMKLTDGTVIRFSGAQYAGKEFVHLQLEDHSEAGMFHSMFSQSKAREFNFERGLDVGDSLGM